MDNHAKTAFLFGYLKEVKDLARKYAIVSEDEATYLYYQNIELYKHQLEQENIDDRIATKMFRTLTATLLRADGFKKDRGALWQIKKETFKNGESDDKIGDSL